MENCPHLPISQGVHIINLMHIAFRRNSAPRDNSLAFPVGKLGARGFREPITAKNVKMPDGTLVPDGAMFHRNFLTDVDNRELIRRRIFGHSFLVAASRIQ
jgi:glutamate dehydrogenase